MNPNATSYPAAEAARLGGVNPDVTTYPASTKPEDKAEHAKYLALESQGKVTRYLDHDGVNHPHGAPFIIWRSVDEVGAPEGGTPKSAAPEDEPNP